MRCDERINWQSIKQPRGAWVQVRALAGIREGLGEGLGQAEAVLPLQVGTRYRGVG